MRQTRWVSSLALAVLLIITTACGSGTSSDTTQATATTGDSESTAPQTTAPATETTTEPADGEPQTVKVGIAMPLTGPSSTNATDLIQYAEYGLEDAAVELAEHGITLEWVLEDTQATAEVGVQALNKLASVENVPIVLTAYSAVVNAMAPLAEDLGVALVNLGAQSPRLAGASPNLINFFPLATVQVEAIADYLLNEAGVQTAGVIYVDNEAGQAPAEAFQAAFEEAGGTIVGMEPVQPEAPDANIPVSRLLAQSPDVIYVQTLVPEGPPVFQAIRDADPDVLIASHGGLVEDVNVREAAGANMNGLVYATFASETPPMAQEIIERFEEDLGREPGLASFIPYYYDFGFLVGEISKQLVAEGRDVTGEEMLSVVRETRTFNTPILGETTFADDLTISAPVTIKRIDDAAASPADDTIIREP